MKINFKVDYRGETASHFTTFPQTETSEKILARNRRYLRDIAAKTSSEISSNATRKARNNLVGGTFNIFV